MARETKLGLLVGLAFIVLFGVILSDRASSPAAGHAILPTGGVDGHRTLARTDGRVVEPVSGDATLVVPGPVPTPVAEKVAPPAEESLPAPSNLATGVAPPPKRDNVGTATFSRAPVIIETPVTGDSSDLRGLREEVIAKATLPALPPPPTVATESGKAVHVVRAGESLTSIAKQYYGSGGEKMWRKIWEANKTSLKDANRLCAGQKLVIPALATEPRKESPAPADSPRKDPLREPVSDTYYADGAKVVPAAPRDKAGLMAELRKMTVPADAARLRIDLPRDAVRRDVSRDVDSRDVGRIAGNQSDFVELPPKAPATYAIQPGDTFLKIASKMYPGDAKAARLLYLKNQHLAPDEKRMKVGQKILLLDGDAPSSSELAVAKR